MVYPTWRGIDTLNWSLSIHQAYKLGSNIASTNNPPNNCMLIQYTCFDSTCSTSSEPKWEIMVDGDLKWWHELFKGVVLLAAQRW